MIAHIVLFRPKTDLANASRAALADAFLTAVTAIPSVRRARLGRRVTHGRPYEQLMSVDYAYGVILEFDDLAGLQSYLDHPAHGELGARFYEIFDNAAMYDYELLEAREGVRSLVED